jgi:hypothetical protein
LNYLLNLCLGDYYFRKKDTMQSIHFYTRSLLNIINLYSENYTKSIRIYHVRSLPNNILPGYLLKYCSGDYPYLKVYSRLADLYNQHDNSKTSTYLKSNLKRYEFYKNLINLADTLKSPPVSSIHKL